MLRSIITYYLLFALNTNAQQKIGLSLSVNGELRDTLYKGEPVLLKIFISNAEAQRVFAWNNANTRRVNELKELLEKNKITR